ncbi:SF3a splicing factor complex subunit [Tulasnella sp. UAMH 9824]|nr:SF3a splicing factor complex subunit [Tulasnella sp. UAMH 9824]
MSALVLPPPKSATNGLDGANGHSGDDTPAPSSSPPKTSKYIEGLIYPPPDIRTIIDRTASFVARSADPTQFEEKLREKHRQDPKFTFVNPTDAYHAYYRHRIEKIKSGEEEPEVQESKKEEEIVQAPDAPFARTKEAIPKEPPAQEFVLAKPSLTALDLDVLKLTALFAARQGQGWVTSLTAREGRNPQFEFLRPTHSLFGYFNRMVDQYTKILIPPPEALEDLAEIKGESGKWKVLERVRERAEWEAYRQEREKRRNDDQEAERKAFAEIDWHDYAIVQTIDFTPADAQSELPPPMSIAEIENMTLAQKKMAALVMETAAPEVEALRAAQAAAENDAATSEPDDSAMQVEEPAVSEAKRKELEEAERARATQALSAAPMKIRKDYVPKTLAAKKAEKTMTTICQICGQSIPVDQLEEHTRIELLDPRWKSQRDALEARRAVGNEQQLGANVVTSLKQLARAFVDDEADEVKRKQLEAEAEAKRKEREKIAWDGFTATKEGTVNKFQSNVNFDEQIASIWKAKGLAGADPSTTGPGIGPSIGPSAGGPSMAPGPPPPALPPSLPPNPLINPATGQAYAAGSVASGPQPATQYGMGFPPPSSFGLPPNPGFMPGPGGFPPQMPPPMGGPMGGMHPSRLAQMSGEGPPHVAGVTRSADEMEGSMPGMGSAPPAKRPKVAKLPEGQYYPEADWIAFHPEPITLSVRLPSADTSEVPLKPEWNMDGSVVEIKDLPVTLLVSTLRERILSYIKSALAAGRVKLSYGNKVLTNSMSLATYNFDDGDEIVLSVRDAKKK